MSQSIKVHSTEPLHRPIFSPSLHIGHYEYTGSLLGETITSINNQSDISTKSSDKNQLSAKLKWDVYLLGKLSRIVDSKQIESRFGIDIFTQKFDQLQVFQAIIS